MTEFSKLEMSILKAKGLSQLQIDHLVGVGVGSKADFALIGNVETLIDLTHLERELAERIMSWALDKPDAAKPAPESAADSSIIIESAEVIYCQHCKTKQPKDYSSGDLCPNCGKQVEFQRTCHWCGNIGPGKFCRVCGARFVSVEDLELALQLRREGVAKDDIAQKLEQMTPADKEVLWGRVRSRY